MQSARLYRQLVERPLPLLKSFFSRSLCRTRAASAVQWLEQAAQQQSCESALNLSTTIIHQADSLEYARQQERLESASSCDGMSTSTAAAAASTATSPSTNLSASTSAGIVLREQELHIPPDFAAPARTSIPVHQLVAVFSSMLGTPVLPKDARVSTMEAKWRMLQLLLLRHTGEPQQLTRALDSFLQFALRDGVRKLGKVMANPKIPEPNKQLAQQQFDKLWTNCHETISNWVECTCSCPNFAILQPTMAELASSIDVSVLMDDSSPLQPNRSREAGTLMEAAAVQAVRDALPEGWTLLTSLHLVGVDGQLLTTTSRGCKCEADMLVLDQQGVAVAIIEVKLAASNPLMALVNDVSNLLRLVDRTAGKALTCITKDDATAAAAAAAAAAAGCSSSSSAEQQAGSCADAELQKKLADMTARPPFAVGPAWHVLHVPVHPEILPVYVLGNDISDASVTRGLNSLVSSGTLRLLSKSPAALAAALDEFLQQRRQQCAEQQTAAAAAADMMEEVNNTCAAVSSNSSSGDNTLPYSSVPAGMFEDSFSSDSSGSGMSDEDSGSFSRLVQDDTAAVNSPMSAAAGTQLQQREQSSISSLQRTDSSSSSMQDFILLDHVLQARSESLNSFRARIRAQLQLDAQQQQVLTEQIWGTLSTLQKRCRIYSLVKQIE